jgi:hypothetical protein
MNPSNSPEISKVTKIIELSKERPSSTSNKENIRALLQDLSPDQMKDLNKKMKTLEIKTQMKLS